MSHPKRLLDSDAFKATLKSEGKVTAVRKELVTEVSEDAGKLSFILSTAAVDRHGDTVSQDGWRLDNYRRNPVVLFGHDQGSPPVGKAPLVLVENGKLVARGVEFTPKDLSPFGHMVGEMYRHGFMNAVSVGFLPAKFNFNAERGPMAMDFEEQELLEFSAVPVPANPEALQGAKSAGIELAPLVEWAQKILDRKESPELVVQRGIAERVWQVAAPKSFSVSRNEEAADEAEDFLVEAVRELTGEMRALRDELSKSRAANIKAAAPPTAPAQSKEEKPGIEKLVKEEVQRRINALTGRID